MRPQLWLAGMVAGTALVVLVGARHHTPPAPETPVARPEVPWLTRAAAAEVIGEDGGLGPLFTGVTLGGTPPLPVVRERIAAFAKANNVTIDLDVVDDEVAAVRFEVMYSGCCGYEAADMLARSLMRPSTGGGCMGGEATWIDDWAFTTEAGVHLRASVRVNRVILRWEPVATLPELLASADELLGADRDVLNRTVPDRWIGDGTHYRLEVPYPLRSEWGFTDALGMTAVVDKGRVSEVSFTIRERGDDNNTKVTKALKEQWGRPRVRDENLTWTKPDRIARAELHDSETTTIRIQRR